MNKTVAVVAIVAAVALGVFGVFQSAALAHSRTTYKTQTDALRVQRDALQTKLGQAKSRNESLQADLSDAGLALANADAQIGKLKHRYNNLLSDYEGFVSLVRLYASIPSYTPTYTSINCTSNAVGAFVYTNCY